MKKLLIKKDVVDAMSSSDKRSVHGGNELDALIFTTSGRPNTAVSCGSCNPCPIQTVIHMPESVGGCSTWMTCG